MENEMPIEELLSELLKQSVETNAAVFALTQHYVTTVAKAENRPAEEVEKEFDELNSQHLKRLKGRFPLRPE